MGPVTIVGLGPGRAGDLTREAWEVLSQATEVYLRTWRHPSSQAIPPGPEVFSFDHLYETHEAFDAIYEAIVAEVWRLAQRPEGVIYAVPGHPLMGEHTVYRILQQGRAAGISVRVVAGLSFVEPVLAALQQDALEGSTPGTAGLQIVDGADIARAYYPPLNTDLPALIPQVYDREMAADVKLTLMNAYPDEHPVTVVRGAGTDSAASETVPLYQLDQGVALDDLTTLYLPPIAGGRTSLSALQDILAHLRSPAGCPWDREQDHLSLRPELLEEVHEVLAALDAEDMEALQEELGDLFLNVFFQVQLATEEGEFRLSDVVREHTDKLIRRHPHVFGDVKVSGTADVKANWDQIKQAEKPHATRGTPIENIPVSLPALAHAQEVSKKAAKERFDWTDISGVWDKVREEVLEVKEAQNQAEREQELGDLLFATVNLARWLNVDAESSLRQATQRFIARYLGTRRLAEQRHLDWQNLTLAEMDGLWEEVKMTR
ncbi:MAG: nucleoside triphosphate pyrophosphohydrolase [Chloroflexi bacterium]|nr:nucleoside triphosphate pyrophosphohydrolase [Chloroflexota bacterium]